MSGQAADERRYARHVVIAVGLVAAATVLLAFLRHITQVLLVFFAAVLFAVLLDGLSSLVRRYLHLPHGVALGLVCTLLVVAVAGTGMLIGPHVAQQLGELSQRLPEAVGQAERWLRQYDWLSGVVESLPDAEQAFQSGALQRFTSFFTTAFGALVNTILVIVVGVYLAANPSLYTGVPLRLIPQRGRARGHHMFETMGHALKRWLIGRLVTMAFIAVLTTVSLWLVGLNLAVSLGLIAGLLSFIPYLGPVLSAIPAVLIGFAEGPQMALYVVVIYVGIQTVESYLLSPLVERRAVYIPPAFQITLQLIAGITAGFLGVLLATPLVVVVTVAVQLLYLEGILREPQDVVGEQ